MQAPPLYFEIIWNMEWFGRCKTRDTSSFVEKIQLRTRLGEWGTQAQNIGDNKKLSDQDT